MVDSDDEYDRKRRDKFRGERSAGDNYRSDRRDERRGREDWMERGRGRPDYYRGGVRDRYSPGRDLPPPKRMRPDWNEDNRPRYGAHDAYGMYGWGHEHYPVHSMHGFGGGGGGGGGVGGGHVPIPPVHNRETQNASDLQTQPPMLTLKQFLDTQDDGISDSEVVRKYSEYKLEFKRQQLNEFFVAHKDEEWFKNKYHPEESQKRKEEQFGFLKKRVNVFVELLEKGIITNVSVDVNQADQLLKLLDTVVIKLEGGTDDDLKVLDEKPSPSSSIEITKTFDTTNLLSKKNVKEQDDDVIITDIKSKIKEEQLQEMSWEPIPSKMKKPKKAISDDDGENWDNDDDENNSMKKDDNWDNEEDNWDVTENKKFNKKDKLAEDDDNWDDDDDDEDLSHKEKLHTAESKIDDLEKSKEDSFKKSSPRGAGKDGESGDHGWDDDENSNDSQKKCLPGKRRTSSESSSASSQGSQKNKKIDTEAQIEKEKKDDKCQEEEDEEDKNDLDKGKTLDSPSSKEQIEKTQEEDTDKTETIDLDKLKDSDINETTKPRALHRTSSIFLRNLAPAITKAEIEAICRRYDGFLRVAIADPLVERRWFRRGWVTFQRDVNIKEICWNLNNIRLRDCEMGAIVNRDLSRRVRPVNGITAHKTIVRSDIKLLAKIALNLDGKFDLWNEKSNSENNGENGDVIKEKSFGFKSRNPVLQNITDYLIEEASAEEDELLGLSSENTSNEGEILDRDPQLIQVLDKLILYMRIVHSVDYYNHCEYPYEDEMPNRCGIIHARGPPPSNKITKQDIEDYIKNFESKMSSFLAKSAQVDQEELKNLGCKDADAEVEKFVQANTQEISKDKWLCPLSGKKFKGPEFIRKHIFNKHMEKVEEVRKEVEYFNNYLKDPKRPQLPEHPGNTKRNQLTPDVGGSQMPYRPGFHTAPYTPPYAAYAPPMIAPPRPRAFGNRRELPPEHQRRLIGYHDLDAPQNFDFFD